MQPHATEALLTDPCRSSFFAGPGSRCLIPFDRREGITIEEAAEVAGKSVRTMRLWCEQHQIGRRVGGGPWVVSVVALRMLLNDDAPALQTYLAGNRNSSTVVNYYEQAGLQVLLSAWQAKQHAV